MNAPGTTKDLAVRADRSALDLTQHERDHWLPDSARELIVKGIPANTLATYGRAWRPFQAACERARRTFAPVSEETMIWYLNGWRALPVHLRCRGGRQSTGEPCPGHRPSPSSMWVWYSAVRFYHGIGRPPLPWECGEHLSRAMVGYSVEMVEQGWEPRKAPRTYPDGVRKMVDALDLSQPKQLRDRAIILTNLYTAARASDLGTYRLGDLEYKPSGIELTLRLSKTLRHRAGKVTEARRIFTNTEHPQYCGVVAVRAWVGWLAGQGVRQGALFRPFDKWGNLKRGDADGLAYRMDTTSLSDVIRQAAQRAGLPKADDMTCHSLRRERATRLREQGGDPISIARAHGWVPGGSILTYLEEAEGWMPDAVGAMGML